LSIGKQPPRYTFLLNPHRELRLSACPTCHRPTFLRKFALFIHIDGWGPHMLRRACKYCSRCEMILCDQAELEAELAHVFAIRQPKVIGNEYLVIGTIDTKLAKAGLSGQAMQLDQVVAHLSDFNRCKNLAYDPGGWRLPGDNGSRWVIAHEDAAARLSTPWKRKKA
jgi:hypothetical protein